LSHPLRFQKYPMIQKSITTGIARYDEKNASTPSAPPMSTASAIAV
jgi:hypothetical protein